MVFETFAEKMKNDLAHRLEGIAEVSQASFLHNNSREIHSLCIRIPGNPASPAISLIPLYECYQNGEDWEVLVREILKFIRTQAALTFPVERMLSWENVKEHIRPMLVNGDKNSRRRELCPHRDILDLTLLYHIKWECSGFGEAISVIHREHMKNWGIQEKDLYETAMENLIRKDPVSCRNTEDLCREIIASESGDSINMEMPEGVYPMLVVTTASRRWGAAAMVLTDWFAETCTARGWGRLYLLPSSVHEIIVIPENEAPSPEYLRDLIAQVNREVVSEEEWLSDSLYVFDPADRKLSVWCRETEDQQNNKILKADGADGTYGADG